MLMTLPMTVRSVLPSLAAFSAYAPFIAAAKRRAWSRERLGFKWWPDCIAVTNFVVT